MAWIKTIEPELATGELASVYLRIAGTRRDVAEVHKSQSLLPKAIVAHLELYKTIVFRKCALSRIERERIAVVVSYTNRCRYCVAHHSAALRQLGDDSQVVAQLEDGIVSDRLTMGEQSLLDWARRMTSHPSSASEAELNRLREFGYDDEAILSATLTCGYFNFVNRLVLLLGVEIEANYEKTCADEAVDS